MALFNKYKNKDFSYITNYINSCINDPSFALTPDELKTQLMGTTQNTFEEFINALLNKNTDGLSAKSPNANILYESNGKMLPLRESYVHIRATYAEKAWLYYVLKNSKADLFIDCTLKEKLLNTLSSMDYPIKNTYFDIRDFSSLNIFTPTPELIECFRNIVTGIAEKKHLILTNKTFSGVEYTNQKVIPYKLEYATQFDSFSLSAYPLDTKRPVKMNLKNISNVTVSEPVEDYDKFLVSFKEMLLQMQEKDPIILEISNRNEAYDRCSYIFSAYEKICYETEEDKLIMQIYYYRFQQNELIRNILFLGPYIKVISPQKIVSLIVSSLQEAYANYNPLSK